MAQPIEARVVGVDKMLYMKSTNANDGTYNLTVSFALGTDPDINTVNVNNRVQTALAELPQAVQAQGLTVQKASSAILEFVNFYSSSGRQDTLFITNYVTISVLDEISRINGVGQASLFSQQKYSMRIWFDSQHLTNLNLTPSDVINAIQSQNVVAPVGRIGARPATNDVQFQLNVQTQGRLTTAKQFGDIVITRTTRWLAAACARRGACGTRRAERRTARAGWTASRVWPCASALRPGPMRWPPQSWSTTSSPN